MAELIDEVGHDRGVDGGREEDAEECAPEMCIVVDVVAAASRHINGIAQEEGGVEDGGHSDKAEECDGVPGADQDVGKEHGAYGAGSPQAAVVIIVFSFEIGRDIGGDECRGIQDRVIIMLQTQFSHIVVLQCGAEEIKREHIKSKMHEIGVDQAAC